MGWMFWLAAWLVMGLAGAASADRVTYIHTDIVGSPVAATDPVGQLVWTEHYQPYGTKIDRPLTPENNDRWYTGKPFEEDLNLSYFGARWYDPAVGRFMAADPVDVVAGDVHLFNRYAYGNNNPYKYVDPDGNLPIIAIAFFAYDFYSNYQETGSVKEAATASIVGMINPFKKVKAVAGIASKVSGKVTKSVAKEPNRIYSARELKRRAENPRNNNSANPNHNFPESFNAEIFKGNKTIVSDKYHLYTKPGTLNGRSGTYEIGVRPSASGRTEVITHRFFQPDKK